MIGFIIGHVRYPGSDPDCLKSNINLQLAATVEEKLRNSIRPTPIGVQPLGVVTVTVRYSHIQYRREQESD